ncbi:MAG: hypothetical protein ACPGES_04370 [Coraliomargarita sp.]
MLRVARTIADLAGHSGWFLWQYL